MRRRRLALAHVLLGLLIGAAVLTAATVAAKSVLRISAPPTQLPDDIPTFVVPIQRPRADAGFPVFAVPTNRSHGASPPRGSEWPLLPHEKKLTPVPAPGSETPLTDVPAPAPPDCPPCPPKDCSNLFDKEPGLGLFDNFSVFFGGIGSKGPEDLGINAGFGGRTAVTWGIPLIEPVGLGLQIGASYDFTNNAVRVLRNVDGTTDRDTLFTTVGLFQRGPLGLVWGVAWDYRSDRYYSNLDLSQWRSQVGLRLTPTDEVGVWGSTGDMGDGATVGRVPFHLRPMKQLYAYWKHTWSNDATTRFWVGVAEEHGRFVLVNPPEPSVHHPLGFGAEVFVPLCDFLSLYGEANFITPNDTGTVTALLGVAIYPRGSTRSVAHSRFNPVLPLASPANFAIDLQR